MTTPFITGGRLRNEVCCFLKSGKGESYQEKKKGERDIKNLYLSLGALTSLISLQSYGA